MPVRRLNAQSRKRAMRLFCVRTRGGHYADMYVYVHEVAYYRNEWIQTGRSYRLSDGAQVHADSPGVLILAATGEPVLRV